MATVKGDPGTQVPNETVAITLDAQITPPLRGIRTGAAGDLAIIDGNGNTRTIPAMVAGETFKCVIQKVLTSGTTITSPTTNLTGLR